MESISEYYKQILGQVKRQFKNFKNVTYDESGDKHESNLEISSDNIVISRINDFTNDYEFPFRLKLLLYCMESLTSVLQNCENESSFEFLSLEKLIETKDIYWQHNQRRFLDIAMAYAGMGWFYVVAWDRITRKFFLRMDGGSNGWDRESNFGYFIQGEGFDLSDEKFKDKLFDFEMFVDICNGQLDEEVFKEIIVK